jgi:hypothetical protein
VPPDFDRQTEDVLCCRKIFAVSADSCTKENRVTVSQELFDHSNVTLLSRFGSCGLFLVPEVEILTKR